VLTPQPHLGPHQPLQDPVVTPQGILYSREAILENLLAQKKAMKRRMATWQAAEGERARKVRPFPEAGMLAGGVVWGG